MPAMSEAFGLTIRTPPHRWIPLDTVPYRSVLLPNARLSQRLNFGVKTRVQITADCSDDIMWATAAVCSG